MALSGIEDRALRGAEEATLGQFLQMVARRWTVLLVVVVLSGAGALALRLLTPHVYTAVASVDVTPGPSTDVPVSAASGATESDVVLSRAVAEHAAATLRTGRSQVSTGQVQSRVSVAAPRQSRILRISYRAPSGSAAAAGADAVADAYLSLRSEQSRGRLIAQETEIRTHLDGALAQINDLPLSEGVQRQFAEREADRLRGQLNYVEATAVDAGQLLDHADVPTEADGPSAAVYVTGALLVGLLLGVPAAVAVDVRRRP